MFNASNGLENDEGFLYVSIVLFFPYDTGRIFGPPTNCVFWYMRVLTGICTKTYTVLGILLPANGVSLTQA